MVCDDGVFDADRGASPGADKASLLRSCERYRGALRAGALIMWRADLAGRFLAMEGWQVLTGRPDAETLDRGFYDRIHPDDRPLFDFRNRESGDRMQVECRILDRNDRWRWTRVRGALIPPLHGFPAEWVGTFEDLHDARLALERARYLAERDALTGLGNRRTLNEHLERLRWNDASATVVMLDVEAFKAVNDLHGHQVGDRFLLRLAQALTESAPAHAVCARVGGDEFCAVVADPAEARDLCARLAAACRDGLTVGNFNCRARFRAGTADADWTLPDPVSTVLRRADLALCHAARQGRMLVAFEPAMQKESDARQYLMHAMLAACRNDEFFLEYQPIVAVEDGAVVSYEALLRWQHPSHGRIEPSDFVRLAEQNGMIGELGRWVLTRACADLAAGPAGVRMNVNISARQLAEPGFADDVAAIARAQGLDPVRLTLELTESVSANAVVIGAEAEGLRRHGFRLVLDDFGTEYAALSHISSGHFDGIKLSRDFIVDCCTSPRAWQVLRHVVNLCDDLELSVVAEGIETDAELQTLRRAGVRLVQGYFFDRPRRLSDLNNSAGMSG